MSPVLSVLQQSPQIRPRTAADPNLTVLPALSAPIDQGILIPKPPRSQWDRLLIIVVGLLIAGGVLAIAFLHATAFH